ncbi:MAG: hypothetical protein DSY81_10750 [Bacillota bacterium]|nr:MAG: hypothetical protein DSY81_10750 [Bacillota bacterium]
MRFSRFSGAIHALCLVVLWPGAPLIHAQSCPETLQVFPDYGQNQMIIEWSLPIAGPGATEYQLFRNGQLIATVDGDTAVATDDVSAFTASRHHVLDYVLVTVGTAAPCLDLTARGYYSTGVIALFEDFENYSSDVEMESAGGWSIVDENNPLEDSTWTLTNPLGRQHPPGIDGHPTRGAFVISDSDYGGATNTNPIGSGMSHDIWTPTMNCSAMGQVALHASVCAQLNNNGNAIFDIDVSTDGGTTWQNAFRRVAPARVTSAPVVTVEDADGIYQVLEVDLSSYAAGQPSVRIRFRHFEPNWDWWIAIDDVLVDDILVSPGGDTILLESEDFSTGIPADWQIDGLNTNSPLNTWNTDDPCNRSITLNNGGNFPYQGGRAVNRLGDYFAILDSDCNPDPFEDERLITPVVDCTAEEHVYLHFDSEMLPYGSETVEVLLSIDAGNSFIRPAIFSAPTSTSPQPGEEPLYGRFVFEEPRAAGQSEVAFLFKYTSSGNQWWWAVDNVSITAGEYAAVPPPPPAGTAFRRGDCNWDNSFNIADCVFLLATLFSGGPQSDCPDACDMNDDGSNNIADAITGLATLFSGAGPLPDPGSNACGLDPTDDAQACDPTSACL